MICVAFFPNSAKSPRSPSLNYLPIAYSYLTNLVTLTPRAKSTPWRS